MNRLILKLSSDLGVMILQLVGDLLMQNFDPLKNILDRPETLAHPRGFIIDCSQLKYADSKGIGALIEIKLRLDAGKIPCRLVGASPQLMHKLQIMRLEDFFIRSDTIREALAELLKAA